MGARKQGHLGVLSSTEPVVAVVIPAYRVASHIEKVVRGVPRWVSWIVVVDDASPDGGADIVRRLAAEDPRVVLLQNERNQGVGGAVCRGYAHALELGADIAVKMDGDDQMDGACTMDVPIPARYGDEPSSLRIGRVMRRFPPLLLRGFLKRLWHRHLMASLSVFGLYVSVGTVLMLADRPHLPQHVGRVRWSHRLLRSPARGHCHRHHAARSAGIQ